MLRAMFMPSSSPAWMVLKAPGTAFSWFSLSCTSPIRSHQVSVQALLNPKPSIRLLAPCACHALV